MPDTAQSEAPEIEALTNTLRACLVRAYRAGKRDGAKAQRKAKGTQSRDQSRAPHRAVLGAVNTALTRDNPFSPSEIAAEFGLPAASVRAQAHKATKEGRAVRVAPGRFAAPTCRQGAGA